MSMSDVGFSSEAPEDLQTYRPLNRTALVAFLLSLLTPLAIVHPLLATVPLVVGALALIALRTISVHQVGRTLAYLALAIGFVFLALGPTRHFTRHQKLHAEARRFAAEWLALLDAGQLQQAHQLTLPHVSRQAADISLDDYYQNPFEDLKGLPTESKMHAPFTDLEDFKTQAPLSQIRRWPNGFEYAFDSNVSAAAATTDTETVGVIFKLTPRHDAEPIRIQLVLQRYLQGGTGFWRVLEFSDPDFQMPRLNRKMNYQG